MPTTKEYVALTDNPHIKIKTCGAVLPNHMQCWRAGDYQVTETTVQPAVAAVAATKDTPATPAVEEKVSTSTYQICAFHKSLEAQTT